MGFWEKFEINENYDFSIAERDMTIAQMLEWLWVYCPPNVKTVGRDRKENDFDIYKVTEEAHKPAGFSKRQLRSCQE